MIFLLSRQETVMEADYDDFVIHDKYYKALPRSNKEEEKSLDMKLIQRGQLEPIRVNRKMWILDGFTRHELLGQRGKKIKYEFMDFESDEDEFAYVIETNVMRRHLNAFQKLETMHELYKKIKNEPQARYQETWYGIINSIKKGNTTVKQIHEDLGHHIVHINMLVKKMRDQYYLSVEKKWAPYDNQEDGKQRGGLRNNMKLMPKSEEFLSKYERKENGGAGVLVGKICGLERGIVSKGITLIDKCDEKTKKALREGKLSISGVYGDLMNIKKSRKGEVHAIVWGKDAKIKCNHCGHIAVKKEYEVVR